MRISALSIPFWAMAPVVLALETALCSVLAAAALDIFVRRPQQGGGSITTLLPGFVYASATVMKVCLVGALLSAVVGLVWRLFARGASKRSIRLLPSWGIASITLTPSTPLLGALAVLAAQNVFAASDMTSASHFSLVSSSAVFVMLAIISAGAFTAATSLIRREQPVLLPIVGLAVNIVLVGLFCYLRFYALGFDQDMWAPR